jgi:NAD(P)-dependent dehydrogenase (short-subunit alcohol dehydrogenase family)
MAGPVSAGASETAGTPDRETPRPLAGRAALVTGAGVRVGRSIALALAQAGADVVVHHGRSTEAAREVCASIEALGRRALPISADLADPAAVASILPRVLAAWGRLDIFVHSAANFFRASLEQTTLETWEAAFGVNVRSAFLLARDAASELSRRRGRIVLITDDLASRPARGYVAHAASKAAVEGLVRALAVELAPDVSVNGVAPGTVLVPEGTPPEDAARWARQVPAKRNGSPEDVAAAVLFFCAGPAFVTGQILHVDGGKSVV